MRHLPGSMCAVMGVASTASSGNTSRSGITRSNLDAEDKALLAALYHAGHFFAGTCGHCDADILRGEPERFGGISRAVTTMKVWAISAATVPRSPTHSTNCEHTKGKDHATEDDEEISDDA